MPELTFRNATEEDVPLILEFIKKLADYEHRLDEVIATEEALKYWIFDKNQAEVIFALEDGKEVHVHVDVEYEGDSQRPSKIIVMQKHLLSM